MTTISTKWTPKKRDYVSEHKHFTKPTTPTTTHPLTVVVVCIKKNEKFILTKKKELYF